MDDQIRKRIVMLLEDVSESEDLLLGDDCALAERASALLEDLASPPPASDLTPTAGCCLETYRAAGGQTDGRPCPYHAEGARAGVEALAEKWEEAAKILHHDADAMQAAACRESAARIRARAETTEQLAIDLRRALSSPPDAGRSKEKNHG